MFNNHPVDKEWGTDSNLSLRGGMGTGSLIYLWPVQEKGPPKCHTSRPMAMINQYTV